MEKVVMTRNELQKFFQQNEKLKCCNRFLQVFVNGVEVFLLFRIEKTKSLFTINLN